MSYRKRGIYIAVDGKRLVVRRWRRRRLLAGVALGFFVVGFGCAMGVVWLTPWVRQHWFARLHRQIEAQQAELDTLKAKVRRLEGDLFRLHAISDSVYWVLVGRSEPPSTDGALPIHTGGSPYSVHPPSAQVSWEDAVSWLDVRIQQLREAIQYQKAEYMRIVEAARQHEESLRYIPAIQPVDNRMLIRIASGFGYRIDPFYRVRKMHYGIDFSCPYGTPVYATADGVVEQVKYSRRGYGIHIIIDHGNGYKTLYAHLSRVFVRAGERVQRGQKIGAVGSTGKSTAPHLHYEVWYRGEKVNPIYYFFGDLTPREYAEIIARANQTERSLD